MQRALGVFSCVCAHIIVREFTLLLETNHTTMCKNLQTNIGFIDSFILHTNHQ